jgi:MFS transporter, Spinster family, sphingosine-1-phosphate transporter
MQQKWKIAAMLALIGALNFGDRTAIASVFPLLRADLGLSDIMLAGIGSVFLWSYAVGSPIAGYLADRFSRTRILLFSLVGWSAVMILTGFVHSGASLLGTRVLLGLSECAYLPAAVALIAEHHGPDTRATALGFQAAGANIGLIGGSAIAGYLGERFGWRVDFLILGASGLLLAVAASFILRDGPQAQPSNVSFSYWDGFWQLLRLPSYVAVVVGAMLISTGTWAFLNWLPLYLYDRFHLSLAVAGLFGSSFLQAAAIIGAVLGGYLSDHLSGGSPRSRMLILATGYFCAAPFLLMFLSKAPLGIINISIFLYSLVRSVGSANESPVICELAEPRLRSTAVGIFNMMTSFAGGLGILGVGIMMHGHGMAIAFGSLTATVTCAGMVVFLGYVLLVRQENRSMASS